MHHILINRQDLKRSTVSYNVQKKDRSSLKLVNLNNKPETKMQIGSSLP
jgi:hypothetical protein